MQISLIQEHEKALLSRMLQAYLGELAEYGHDQPDENGAYPYPYLETYWKEVGRYPYCLLAGDIWAGFGLINRHTLSADDAHAIAEFYVAPEYRRKGYGMSFAEELLSLHPGHWEISHFAGNLPAHYFWKKAIESISNEAETHERDGRLIYNFSNRRA